MPDTDEETFEIAIETLNRFIAAINNIADAIRYHADANRQIHEPGSVSGSSLKIVEPDDAVSQ